MSKMNKFIEEKGFDTIQFFITVLMILTAFPFAEAEVGFLTVMKNIMKKCLIGK